MYILWRPKHKNEGYKSDNSITESKNPELCLIKQNDITMENIIQEKLCLALGF